MERRFNWLDRLLAAGFVRPGVLISGLRLGRPALSRCPITVPMALSGLVLEPLPGCRQLFTRGRSNVPIFLMIRWW